MNDFRVAVVDLKGFVKDLGVAARFMDRAEVIFALVTGAQIAVEARELAQRGTHMQSAAARDVRQMAPGVVEYGGRPYSIGAEFGALQYEQFEQWRGSDPSPTEGYFFWRAVRNIRDNELSDNWEKEVWSKLRPAFPD